MDAYDFGKFHPVSGCGDGVCFGVDPERTAAALRDLASQIEKGRILVQRAHVVTAASPLDYASTRVVLVCVERQQPPAASTDEQAAPLT